MEASLVTASASASQRLFRLLLEERRRLLFGSLFVALSTALALAYPLLIRAVIDGIAAGSELRNLEALCVAMLAILVVEGIAIGLRQYHGEVAAEAVALRLRRKLYGRLLEREQAFFDSQRTGELLSRLGGDIAVLQQALSPLASAGCHALRIVGGTALLVYASWKLTLWLVIVVVPTGLAVRWAAARIRALSRQAQDALADANHAAQEALSGIQTVRLHGQEALEARRYGSSLERAFELARQRSLAGGALEGWTNLSVEGAAVLVLLIGSRAVASGELTLGWIVAFVVIAGLVAASVKHLTRFLAELQRALGSSERVFELAELRPEAAPAGRGAVPPPGRGEIRLRGVRFRYPTRPDVLVLDDVELELRAGEHVALVGPSGSGKSTLARLLTRLYDPSEGSVAFDGADLQTLDPAALRRLVAVVPQESVLFSMTLAENIRYARPEARDAELARAAADANCGEFLARLPQGLATLVGERGLQLSGGQRQRVAIARALLREPRLLILDEATSTLDAESESLVREALERLMRGRTTLVIAHRLSTLANAERVLVLDRGRIVQSGSHRQLLRDGGIYRRLVEAQLVSA